MDWLYLVSLECQWPNKVIRVLLSDLILFSVLICLWCTSLCKVWLDPLWIGQKCWQLILMGTEETAQALTQKTEKRSLPLNLGGWVECVGVQINPLLGTARWIVSSQPGMKNPGPRYRHQTLTNPHSSLRSVHSEHCWHRWCWYLTSNSPLLKRRPRH